jgi:hypothetical protein
MRWGGYGSGRKVKSDTVATALSSVGKEISLAIEVNPVKLAGSERMVPRLAQTLDGWRKEDGPVMKKLPVEADVPELLVKLSLIDGSPFVQAVADLATIAFYYLLRIGEYTVKGQRNESKQTRQFKLKDVTFFKRDKWGRLRQLPRTAPARHIMTADCATLKLDNQKNGWHGVCINHEWNGDDTFDAVRALGRRYLHIRDNSNNNWSTYLSAVFTDGTKIDVRDRDIRAAIKKAAAMLDYPASRGIPIERIDTHSLRIGGANALSLAGYSDRQIQKMGRWRGETFKEYVREQLSNFSEGMSKSMRKCFGFVNVEGGVFHDVTSTVTAMEYNMEVSTASAA